MNHFFICKIKIYSQIGKPLIRNLMLIAIRYTKGDNLVLTLALIQPQISEKDDIYIIDTTPEKEGFNIAKKYGTSRSFILTEIGNYDSNKSIEIFEEYAKENKHRSILYIRNVLISTTFISNLKKAISISKYKILSPEVLPNRELLNPNFKWYYPPTNKVIKCNFYTPQCFCVNTSKNRKNVGIFDNEKIVVF